MSLSRPFDFIKDLNDSKHLWKIAVMITQIWYVQIPPKPEHLEMILMDSKVTQNFIASINLFQFLYLLKLLISYLMGDKIQVSVRKDDFNQWSQYLPENNTYVMHNFNVMRNDLHYKVCDHLYRMQFTPSTTLKQREFPDIPELE
ncbi:putative nucleic acid-binding protein [Lupinus albus]|uniref:Putative nucleic acid-binding protein n=1 Tax=Lupinus albus TaxID=3870 RepID=A0A6A4NIJ4_LUPAL|nr:putative nucleic acid-binding protein [Lupinus albus]